MLYYEDSQILIRDFTRTDAEIITREEIAQGWHQTIDKYLARLEDQSAGLCVSLAAEYQGRVCGYINVYKNSVGGPFATRCLPEIVDFGVLERFRGRGIGTALITQAETVAASYSDTVCLAVGLHSGYGSAQRMYCKRGYIPDGTGVWYAGRVCEPYAECANDDELVLYMSKKLR